MTIHEISPKQLRALLLLLVLVPFIPLVLMLRFMVDALDGEHNAARERFASDTQRSLMSATAALEKRLAAGSTAPDPETMRRFCRDVCDPAVEICIQDATGRIVAGPTQPKGKFITQTYIKHRDATWSAQAWLIDEGVLRRELRDLFRIYLGTAFIAAIAICAIAATAGLAVNQQLRLHELKNNSVATVAHELRTPLATMRMLVDTLREGRYRNTEQLLDYLDLLHDENLRLSRLTEHFLTHSRLARGQHTFTFAPVDFDSVVGPALAALQPRLDAPGCTFTLDLAKPLPEVMADRDSLITVLINLLENALKYSGDEKRILLRVCRAREELFFVVQDNGVGLTSAQRKRIFEPFFQVDQKLSRSRSGCGLGLSIVQAIVSAHHGRVLIDSEPGQGAAFAVLIPLAPA